MKLIRKSPCSKKVFCRSILFGLRWFVVLIGLAFTIQGWVSTVTKYLTGKTAFSSTENETDLITYPSITICSPYKENARSLALDLTDSVLANKSRKVVPDLNFFNLNATYSRSDFITYFSHPRIENWAFYEDISRNNSLWTVSTPSLYSGSCFTYNPPHQSKPRDRYAMNFMLNFPVLLVNDSYESLDWLNKLRIFLHDKNQFIFYTYENMPSHVKVDNAYLKEGRKTLIVIKYSKVSYLNTLKRPCSSDKDYSFGICFEKARAKQRRCQKPWFYFPEFKIRKCESHKEVFDLLQDIYEPFFTVGERENVSGCLRSCKRTVYELQYSFVEDIWSDFTSKFPISIYFEDFNFRYEEEYLACDWTCLIGEIGGNFGFFLGGSIIALYDIIYSRLLRIISRMT